MLLSVIQNWLATLKLAILRRFLGSIAVDLLVASTLSEHQALSDAEACADRLAASGHKALADQLRHEIAAFSGGDPATLTAPASTNEVAAAKLPAPKKKPGRPSSLNKTSTSFPKGDSNGSHAESL